MKQIWLILACCLLIACSPDTTEEETPPVAEQTDPPTYPLDHILGNWSASFVDKVDSTYRAAINFTLSDAPESYHVLIADKDFAVVDGVIDSANFSFESTLAHYNKIFNEEMTAMTSMGQATSSDPIPLEPEVHKPVTDNALNDFLFVAQRFFNKTPYDRVQLGLANSRVVHGAHAIPIFYQKSEDIGVRSAWYQINKGEQVNEIGDTNPFPQYFIITQGRGYAKIGADTLEVKANEAYFIPPDHDHVFWNEREEPMVYVFLAWGKGA